MTSEISRTGFLCLNHGCSKEINFIYLCVVWSFMARLNKFFETFLTKETLFLDKKPLQANFTPEQIEHRDDYIDGIANILAPALRLEKPSNLFIYGKTGTGKTLAVRYTADELKQVARDKNIPLKIFYLNCKLKKVVDTEYRLIAQLARFFGKAIPATGLPTDEVYSAFYSALDSEKQVVLLILDEIDQLVKRVGDEVVYNLTRINSELEQAQLSIIGISNDLLFADNLEPRVKSSLSEEELVFPPYNAVELQGILKERSAVSFKEDVLEEGVIPKCAAYAAREHGDARRALELLRVSGEIAERRNQTTVSIMNIDEAEEKLEKDRLHELVRTQPKQFQATLYAIIDMSADSDKIVFTGEVYDLYKDICKQVSLRPLTQRRVSDIIAELDMLGIIHTRIISKGRYGRTKQISLSIPSSMLAKIKKLVSEDLGIS